MPGSVRTGGDGDGHRCEAVDELVRQQFVVRVSIHVIDGHQYVVGVVLVMVIATISPARAATPTNATQSRLAIIRER